MRKSFRASRSDPERALAALRWRGPDGAELLDVGGFRLGVARLAITDGASGQPIVCPRTGRAVALNGALTSAGPDWERLGHRVRTRNDAELLLARLDDGGEAAMLDVTGPYAFAVVDPATDGLWLGRDPLGEKPLMVVHEAGRVVAFASTAAALRGLGLQIGLREAEVARFFRFGFTTQEAFESRGPRVSWLEPGLIHDGPEGTRTVTVVPAVHVGSGAPVADALRAGVGRCVEAEVPVGLCLSGGIDSACIAACLRERGTEVRAYQARAEGEAPDERERARAVAARTGLELVEVEVGPRALAELPRLTAMVGAPLGDPSVLAVCALARRAAADGVRVLLSGEGGDELLLGYDRHRAALAMPRRGLSGLPAPALSTARGARLWRALGSAHVYESLLEVSPPGFRRAVLAAELVAGRLPAELLDAAGTLEQIRRADRAGYLRGDLLPKLDVATMAAGIEGRCPFLDPAVLRSREVTTPSHRSVLGKRPLRQAFAASLPPGHFDQQKRGFAVPVDRWWREDSFLPDLLLERRTLQRPHLRPDGVRRMLDRHRRRRSRLGHALYLIVAFELYLRSVEAVT